MYTPGKLLSGEAWAMQLLPDNSMVFSDLSGHLKVGEFTGYTAANNPGIKIKNDVEFESLNFVKVITQLSPTTVVFGTAGGEVYLYNLKSNSNKLLYSHNFNMTGLSRLERSNMIVSVSDNKEMILWDTNANSEF